MYEIDHLGAICFFALTLSSSGESFLNLMCIIATLDQFLGVKFYLRRVPMCSPSGVLAKLYNRSFLSIPDALQFHGLLQEASHE